jgi:hypothetical protein
VTLAAVVVVVVVGVVVLVVVLVEVVVVVGTVVLVVLDVDVVVGVVVDVVLVDVLVEVDVDVDVDVLDVEDVLVVVVVEPVGSFCLETTEGPRTPRAAATPIPHSSASASTVAAKRVIRRGRGFTGDPPGDSGGSLTKMPGRRQTCAALAKIPRSGHTRRLRRRRADNPRPRR